MSQGRSIAVSLALLLAAGCASGGSTPAPAPAQQQAQSVAQFPAESSAARHILANAGRGGATSRSPQGWDGRDDADDDGGWGELTLPAIQSCGNGTYATDCTVWVWGTNGSGSSGGTRSAVRSTQSVSAGTPPALNFCRDAALFPSDLGAPASPLTGLGTSSFSLSYSGTKATPIVSFATRWWNVKLERTFSGNATFAPAIGVTPVLTNAAARGWLVFFTWSWPSDIMLVPYAINEIQVAGLIAARDPGRRLGDVGRVRLPGPQDRGPQARRGIRVQPRPDGGVAHVGRQRAERAGLRRLEPQRVDIAERRPRCAHGRPGGCGQRVTGADPDTARALILRFDDRVRVRAAARRPYFVTGLSRCGGGGIGGTMLFCWGS